MSEHHDTRLDDGQTVEAARRAMRTGNLLEAWGHLRTIDEPAGEAITLLSRWRRLVAASFDKVEDMDVFAPLASAATDYERIGETNAFAIPLANATRRLSLRSDADLVRLCEILRDRVDQRPIHEATVEAFADIFERAIETASGALVVDFYVAVCTTLDEANCAALSSAALERFVAVGERLVVTLSPPGEHVPDAPSRRTRGRES